MRLAVVGHVEWVQFLRVERMPSPGDIVHAVEAWEEPAGGGPGAGVQLAKLGGSCALFTALGDDDLGHRSEEELRLRGLEVHTVYRSEAQRRAVTFIDGRGERAITIVGQRLHATADDPLPWGTLDEVAGVYFTAGDPGALRHARRAKVLVCTARVLEQLRPSGVQLDAIVGSEEDESEQYETGDLHPVPHLAVLTRGKDGGRFSIDGAEWRTYPPTSIPGPIVDTYGAGDSFAAGLTYGLAVHGEPERAIEVAARCGAAVLTGRGPYTAQLTADELGSVR
ncbi:MAG: PfkB family carbohydrate kinase [Actinomycetota bacterium]